MDVLMPQLGETVAEGKITKWFKTPGEAVAPGDNLFEIETDKVSMEVPAIAAGVLAEVRAPVGTVAPVGAVVAVIATGDAPQRGPAPVGQYGDAAARQAPALPRGRSVETAGGAQTASPGGERPVAPAPLPLDPFFEVRTPPRNYGPARIAGGAVATPLARRLAGENNIDLARLKGSGPGGRIVARDVDEALAGKPSLPPTAMAAPSAPASDEIKALYADTPHQEAPLDAMRRVIAARLTQAVQAIPHFHLTADIELDRLLALRDEANTAGKGAADVAAFKLSINDCVIKALALALQRVPAANAVWAHDRLLRFGRSDIGVAVALDGGLVTPIIRDAAAKSLSAIAAETKELAARARDGKLKPQDYQGGVSTVSNLGMYGVRAFSAIINPPQATILAIGAAERRPVETADGGVRFVSRMTVTLSCDHRVIDGALGAELLAALRGFLEQPVTMLV